jgi:aryl-alcohol dehydrogenase-like predicted oxidoreductase
LTRLILGTAQFGSAYGITNAVGRLSNDSVSDLLRLARSSGIETFDTAADYGDSQDRMGALAAPGAQYITKFHLPDDGGDSTALLFEASRAVLRVNTLYGVMFHRMSDLRDARASRTVALLQQAISDGIVGRIGVSVYDIDDLRLALEVFPELNLVQLPGNILDRRLLGTPLLADLHDRGVEIHVRSAFLQGVLLTEPARLAPFLSGLRPALVDLRALANSRRETVLGMSLRYLRDHALVDGVLTGATTVSELGSIVQEWQAPGLLGTPVITQPPSELLDPRRWQLRDE